MKEQETITICKQFIETLLLVPTVSCMKSVSAISAAMEEHLPEFLRRYHLHFITETILQALEPHVLYHITNPLGLNFNVFLSGEEGASAVIVGPYLAAPPDGAFCEQILQNNQMTLSLLIPFTVYCQTLPVVANAAILSASRIAIKVVTGRSDEIPYHHYEPYSSYQKNPGNLKIDETEEASMELLEHRYRYEKLLLQEVAQGNQDLALEYFRQFSMSSNAIVRTEDPIRTSKNLGFSLNTMLRKSAEQAGIHPIFLDIISNNFALLIENSTRLDEVSELKSQMISAYCRFVQRYRLDQYSPLVRKAVTYIRVHLSDSLSLNEIAAGCKVSPSYLSRIFNRELSESVSVYITNARIEKAAELLSFSRLPVQQIAAYVGFSDLNYFSRCFKQKKGMTPTKYRASSSISA